MTRDRLKSSALKAVLRRATKPIPVIGTVVVLATAASVLRRKGILRGGLDVALDAVPFVGTAKALVELVTGDLIPDRERAATPPTAAVAVRPRRRAA